MTRNLDQLIRLRWAVRGTVAAITAVSVAANVLHAQPNPISQGIAAVPPLALLGAIELIARIPATARLRAFTRIAAAASIAGVAGWISYWHMVGTVAAYGETGLSAYLWPLTVDGLMVVASVSLVELAIQIRDLTEFKEGPRNLNSVASDSTLATEPSTPVVAAAEAMTAGAAAVAERPVWLPERTTPAWTPLNQRTRKAA